MIRPILLCAPQIGLLLPIYLTLKPSFQIDAGLL